MIFWSFTCVYLILIFVIQRMHAEITYIDIELNGEIFYTGRPVSGEVVIFISKPQKVRGIHLELSCNAKCHWESSIKRRTEEGRIVWHKTEYDGEETCFKKILTLHSRGDRVYILPTGIQKYPFSIKLPELLPSTFRGVFGDIIFNVKASVDIPWDLDKREERSIIVRSSISRSHVLQFNKPYRDEESKMFCCWWCASGPLTVSVHVPRTIYTYNDTIPITIEVVNRSRVEIDSIIVELNQKIIWRATDAIKYEKNNKKRRHLNGVQKYASKTLIEYFQLGPDRMYPNSGNCKTILIRYGLEVRLVPNNVLHEHLNLKIPITIGDTIQYEAETSVGNTGRSHARPIF